MSKNKNQDCEWLREKFPVGTKICLEAMNDPQAIEPGTIGTVKYIDDAGNIHMSWNNGRTLALIYGVDQFHVVESEADKKTPAGK